MALSLLLVAGCDASPRKLVEPAPPPAPAPIATVPPDAGSSAPPLPAEPPLPHAGELVDLEVEGFGAAVVAVPPSARPARPVLVATHGNYDGPVWQCQEWQRIVSGRAFVLCPRGKPRADSPAPDDIRFTYANNDALERELDAALDALKRRFGEHVDTTGAVYTGFSLGAIMGTKIAARRPELYPRLVLVEGGYDEWTHARAKAFAKGGGMRVLFLCGQKACELASRRVGRALEGAGLKADVGLVPNLGHTYGGPMTELARARLDWVVEGDARWQNAP